MVAVVVVVAGGQIAQESFHFLANFGNVSYECQSGRQHVVWIGYDRHDVK